MSHRSLVLSATLLVLVFSLSARSQEQAPASEPDKSAIAATRKKAIDLVISVAVQTDMLRSGENRARIRSNAAELLWDDDEKRSRQLFGLVQEDIRSGFSDSDSDYTTHLHTISVFGQLRRDTVDRIAKHDPELALEFLNATQLPPETKVPEQLRAFQDSLDLRLALQISAKSPQLALKLGRESLAKGFSGDLLKVLTKVQRKDKEASRSFYKEIVDKVKDANLVSDVGTTNFVLNLLQTYQPPYADQEIYRELLGILVTTALANGCENAPLEEGPLICYAAGSVFPQIAKYYSSRAAALKRWTDDDTDESEDYGAIPAEVTEVTDNGTVEEILELVSRYPDMQSRLYWQAFMKAISSGDLEKARQVASSNPNAEEKRVLLNQLDGRQKTLPGTVEKLAGIQQSLSRMYSDSQRIRFLLQAAGWMAVEDRKGALGLLRQAGQMIDNAKPGETRMEEQIALAIVYCRLKSDRGFAVVESLIPKLNQLVAAASELDGFGTRYLRDEEWNMSGEGVVGQLLNKLAQNAGVFGRLDFDRSVALANQMERSELRLMAQLKIAQGVLREQPSHSQLFQGTYGID